MAGEWGYERARGSAGDRAPPRTEGGQGGSFNLEGAEELLEDEAVDLVDDKDGLHSLQKGLAEDGVGLDTDALHTVHDHKRPVAQANGRRDLSAGGGGCQRQEGKWRARKRK